MRQRKRLKIAAVLLSISLLSGTRLGVGLYYRGDGFHPDVPAISLSLSEWCLYISRSQCHHTAPVRHQWFKGGFGSYGFHGPGLFYSGQYFPYKTYFNYHWYGNFILGFGLIRSSQGEYGFYPGMNPNRLEWSAWTVRIPAWPAMIAGILLVAAACRPQRKFAPGLCSKCAYDLRGSTHSKVCPECGTPISDGQLTAFAAISDEQTTEPGCTSVLPNRPTADPALAIRNLKPATRNRMKTAPLMRLFLWLLTTAAISIILGSAIEPNGKWLGRFVILLFGSATLVFWLHHGRSVVTDVRLAFYARKHSGRIAYSLGVIIFDLASLALTSFMLAIAVIIVIREMRG